MRGLRILALGTLVGAVSTAALAFQEQRQGAPSAAPQEQAAPAGQGSQFTLPGGAGKPAAGTEIRIPGLGSLGVLPKMDFGLELLYGAADSKNGEAGRSATPDSDDMQIKGTLRRRF